MPFVPRRSVLGAAACAVAICRPGAAASSRSHLDVTRRASRYVSRHDQDLRAIVADEQHIQPSFPRFGEARDRPSAVRRLRSQVA